MSTAVIGPGDTRLSEKVENVLMAGDLQQLTPPERVSYYKAVCESVGLNPLTRPFDYLVLNGRLVLYARKDCTDQLRSIHGISVNIVARELTEGVYVVTSRATKPNGRTDESIGAVPLENLRGEQKANALMKAETKSKRRVTLSICGLGMLDETEVESIPNVRRFEAESKPPHTVRGEDMETWENDPLAKHYETSKPVAKIDIGPHQPNTQAAANYVRDQKLERLSEENRMRDKLTAEAVEANRKLQQTIRGEAQETEPEEPPEEPERPARKSSGDPYWNIIRRGLSAGKHDDKLAQFTKLVDELRQHLPEDEVEQARRTALEHVGLERFDQISRLSDAHKVAYELYQMNKALDEQRVARA